MEPETEIYPIATGNHFLLFPNAIKFTVNPVNGVSSNVSYQLWKYTMIV